MGRTAGGSRRRSCRCGGEGPGGRGPGPPSGRGRGGGGGARRGGGGAGWKGGGGGGGGGRRGTRVRVRVFFFNTPARGKFWRARARETGAVVEALSAPARPRPDTGFALPRDPRALLDVPPADGPLER